MIENWKQYKDLEYYPDRVCKCGCGSRIKVKPHQKYYKIPLYIVGHNDNDKFTVKAFRTKFCECGCGEQFKDDIRYLRRFISGHNGRGILQTPREIRVCECGCKETFRCKVNSEQRYIHNHHQKGKNLSEETKRKISIGHSGKSCKGRNKLPRIKKICPGCGVEFITPMGYQERAFHSKKCYWEWMEGKYRTEETKKKIGIGTKKNWNNPEYVKKVRAKVSPNKPEKKLINILNILFPDEYKYVGNGQFIVAGKNPDFVNVNGQKKIIELYGDYWHRNDNPQDRIDLFRRYGFQTLIVWEHEVDNKSKLEKKLFQFNNYYKSNHIKDIVK